MFEESIASVPSIWASMNSWLTPTVLFVLLNLMIGTIAITSSLATHHKPTEQQEQENQAPHGRHHQMARSPSMLERLKSINLCSYRSQEPTSLTFEKPQEFEQPPLTRSPSMLQRLKSISTLYSPQQVYYYDNDKQKQDQPQEQEWKEEEEEEEEEENEQIQDQEQTLDEIYKRVQGKHVNRSNSDTKPSAGEVPAKLSKKMKKSASTKSAFAHFEEDDIVESRRPATMREGQQKGKLTDMDDAEVDAKADDFINKFKQQLKLQRLDSIMSNKEMIGRGSGK